MQARDMIEIEMSKDIKSHDVKVLGPFTARQLACMGIASVYGIPLIFVLPGTFLIRSVIVLILMMPVVLCGWCKAYGMPLEKFVIKVIRTSMTKRTRKYVTENRYDYLVDHEYDQPVKSVNRRDYKGIR